jgi:hypothetical protein
MKKKTRFVRVRVDYVLAFDEEHDSLPPAMCGLTEKGAATDLIVDGLRALAERNKIDFEILPHARYQIGLFFPRAKKTKSKRAA